MTAWSRLLVRRDLCRHPIRAALAIVALACGTASIVAAMLLYDAFVRSYEDMVDAIAQGADLQIANGGVGVPESLVETVRAIPGVASAAPVIHSPLVLRRPQRERLYLHGVDVVAGDPAAGVERGRVVVPDPLLFLSDPDSVAVTRMGADRHGWRLGSSLEVRTTAGVQHLTVRAIVDPVHWAGRAFGDRLLIMDLPAAQRVTSMGERVSQIDVRVAAGANVERVETKLGALVRGRAHVSRPSASGDALRRLLRGYRYGLTVGVGLALLVALYVMVNAMVIAVTQKQGALGTLARLGTTEAERYRLIELEALVLGLVGSTSGAVAGLHFAKALARRSVRTVSALYLDLADPIVRFDARAMGAGFLAALAIVLIAARAVSCGAARRSVRAERRHAGTVLPDRRAARWFASAGVGLAVSVAAGFLGGFWSTPRTLVAALGVPAVFLAVTASLPLAVPALLDGCDLVFARRLGATGLLVRRTLRAELVPLMVASSALLASLAGALGLGGLVTSLEGSLAAGLRAALANVDVIVTRGEDRFSQAAVPIGPDLVAKIARVPGVAYVDPITAIQIPYEESLTAVVAGDAALLRDGRRSLHVLAPDRDRALARLAAGDGVLVTNTFARRFGHDVDDAITLTTPSGAVTLPVLGRYLFEPSAGDVGAIRLDRRLYERLYGSDQVTAVHVTLRSQADESLVVRRLQRRIGDRNDLFVMTVRDLREQYYGILDGLTSLLTPLLIVACLLGSFGLLAGRFATLEGRRRSLEVLRTLGATERQRAIVIVVESLVLGGSIAILAAIAGAVLGYLEVRVALSELCRIDLPYVHPTAYTAEVLLAGSVLGVVSGMVHGRLIARLRPQGTVAHG
jgi:putative ABC transport system permease protein